jgi:nucleoside-diphosphate-sugar epimerase
MVRTWFGRLPIIITRPFNYTGPGQDERFLIPKIVGHLRRGATSIALGNLNVSRDFSDVRDVVAAYIALLESNVRSETVNICRGRAVALREILGIASDVAGYELEITVEPSLVRPNEITTLFGSNEKLRQLIGMTPEIPIEKTVRDMFLA